MEFLYPSFLWALGFLSIPVLVHFFSFRTFRTVYFSNSAFLTDIAQKSRAGSRLHNILVLVLRCLAMVFLVLAFAHPVFSLRRQRGKNVQTELVVLYIDNSRSMGLMTPEGSLLDVSVRKARQEVALFPAGTRFIVMSSEFAGSEAALLFAREVPSRLQKLRTGPFSRNLASVFSRAQSLASREGLQVSRLLVFSDFQQNTLPPRTPHASQKWPPGLELFSTRAEHVKNISVDTVWFGSPVFLPGFKNTAVLRLSRSSLEMPFPKTTFKVNGQLLGVQSHSAGQGLSVRDSFSFVPGQAGWQNLEFSVSDGSLDFDNTLYASVPVEHKLDVLLVSGDDPSSFLKAIFGRDSLFHLIENAETQIDFAGLGKASLVILDRPHLLSSGLALELLKFLNKGGNVLYIPAMTHLAEQRRFLENFKVNFPLAAVNQQLPVLHLDLRLGIFKGIIEHLPRQAALPRVKRFLRFSKEFSQQGGQLLSLTGGDALLETFRKGRGTWFTLSAPLEDSMQSLQRENLFLPLMYQIARSARLGMKPYYRVLEDEMLDLPPSVDPGLPVFSKGRDLRLQGSQTTLIPGLSLSGGRHSLYVSRQISRAGFYTLAVNSRPVQGYAFNEDRAESRLEYASQAQLASMGGGHAASSRLHAGNPGKANASDAWLWKVCLILALVFLGLEEWVLHQKKNKLA